MKKAFEIAMFVFAALAVFAFLSAMACIGYAIGLLGPPADRSPLVVFAWLGGAAGSALVFMVCVWCCGELSEW